MQNFDNKWEFVDVYARVWWFATLFCYARPCSVIEGKQLLTVVITRRGLPDVQVLSNFNLSVINDWLLDCPLNDQVFVEDLVNPHKP